MFFKLIVLCLLAFAYDAEAQCTVVAITNGTPSPAVGQSVADSGTLSVTCASGFVASAASTTCSGTSFAANLTCTAITCAATSVTNGVGTTGTTNFNGAHSFTCNSGYVISGTANLTCDGTQSDNWSAAVPTCVFACNAAPTLTQGTFPTMPTGGYGGSVSITCNAGYISASGAATSATCSATNTWNPTSLTCTVITCSALTVANGVGSTTTTAYNGAITVTCNSGYVLSGTASLTCDGTGSDNWSTTVPTCNAICSALSVTNGVVSPSGTVALGGSVTVTCNTGYTLSSTSATLTCDGTLSNNYNVATPTCSGGNSMLFQFQAALMVTLLSAITLVTSL